MRDFDYFGGVDFSGAKEPLDNLWCVLGCERDGKLHVLDLRPLPFREDLAQHVSAGWREVHGVREGAGVLWGVDFPLGLPIAAAMMLLPAAGTGAEPTWAAVVKAVAEAAGADAVRASCEGMSKAGRQTDAASGSMAPLDLRLYKQTVEGLRWLDELSRSCEVAVLPQRPSDSAGCTLIEVYPSVTRTDLGIKPGRVPRRPGEVRARPAALSTWVTFEHPAMEATAVAIEDAWDAVMACLTAWLVREDLDQPARVGADKAAKIEGWIYRIPQAVQGQAAGG